MLAKLWDPRTARVLMTALLFALVLAFLHGARETLTLFLFAILFAYFTDPMVARLERPLRGRIPAIAIVYLGITGVLIGLGFLIGPRIASEGKQLATSLPDLLNRVASGQFIDAVGQNHNWGRAREQQIQSFFMTHRTQILGYGEGLASRLEAPLSHLWWLILIPILSVFFLRDAAAIAAGLIKLGRTQDDKRFLAGVVKDVNIMLGSYIRAQLILASLTVVVLTIVLSLMRVPYAFILGPLAGVCEFVPVVGPAIASSIIFGIGILAGYPHLLWLFLFLGTWRVIQDYINAPRIMSKSVEVSPLATIFGVLAGGEIGGVIGALVAVPTIAFLRILWLRFDSTQGPDEPAT